MASFELLANVADSLFTPDNPNTFYVVVAPVRGLPFIAGPFSPEEAQAFMEAFEENERIWRIIEDIKKLELQAMEERREDELRAMEERNEADLQAMDERREAELQEFERMREKLINDLYEAGKNLVEELMRMPSSSAPEAN